MLLNVQNISCGYDGTEIVKDLSFFVDKGEILSVTGPNGCGKTTLLRAIAGLLPYKNGSVAVNGKELNKIKRRELAVEIALLSQNGVNGDYSDFTVYDTVMLGRYARQNTSLMAKTSETDINAVETCMKRTGVYDLRGRMITELSGGQLQRVFLARAFAQEPSLILLDEPANHLDLKHQLALTELLHDWVKDGKSVIGVFHDINLALNVSDRIMVMDDGKNVMCDTAEKVCKSAKLSAVYGFDIGEYMRNTFMMWK